MLFWGDWDSEEHSIIKPSNAWLMGVTKAGKTKFFFLLLQRTYPGGRVGSGGEGGELRKL